MTTDPKQARSRDYIDFGDQPGPYIAAGVRRTPILYQAVQYHRGLMTYKSWGLFKVADYASPEAALKAAEVMLDARQRNGEIAYYIEDIYVIPTPERWLRVNLLDPNGRLCEVLEGPATPVSAKAAAFMVSQGTDPDEDGAAAMRGSVTFEPIPTPASAFIKV